MGWMDGWRVFGRWEMFLVCGDKVADLSHTFSETGPPDGTYGNLNTAFQGLALIQGQIT